MTRIKKKHRHRDHHGRGYIFMRVTVRKPDVHGGAEQRELCETISALLDLTSSALYLADLRGETISSWNAEEHGRGERFSRTDAAGLFRRCGFASRERDETLEQFIDGIFSGREGGRMIRTFSPLLEGEPRLTEISYKTLRGSGGEPERAMCLIRRLRIADESEPFCAEYRARLEDWLRRGIENGRVKLYLQPKVNLINGMITGAEVLTRYDDPREGLVMPDDFIPKLEEAGLIRKLDLYVLDRSYALLRKLTALGKKPLPLSVNFSKKTLLSPDITGEVCKIDRGFEELRRYMEIELTENVGNVSRDDFTAACKALRGAGYKLTLDDFGSKYSNLYMLSAFRFDVVKIDKSIVAEVAENEISRLIVESTVGICDRLGIGCIAEGVEREEQASVLKGLGCAEIQGYLIDRPLPCEEFIDKYFRGL